MEITKYKPLYYKQVLDIYEKSFPIEERYISLDNMITKNNTELYCLVNDKDVLGFIYSIQHKDMIFILYLAIDNKFRSKGYGSYILKWLLKKYENKKIFLNIEEVRKDVKDYEIREKRLKFYLKNELFLTDYISKEKEENFNILSNSKFFDIEQYKILDKIVAEIIDEPTSEICILNKNQVE